MRQSVSDIEFGKLPEAFVERTAPLPMLFDKKKLGENFPEQQWSDQTGIYASLWQHYSGDVLAETRPDQENEPETQYPLHMNVVRTLCEKHASILFGEVPDGPEPLVKITVKARKPFNGTEAKETDKKLAEMCERIINEVVVASYGRAKQLENGIFSQFLGGHVFQLSYQPSRTDLLIPIVLQNPRPDYFLPIWKNEDLYTLSECWTIYQIPEIVAKRQYGVTDGKPGQKAVYVDYWTENTHVIRIEGAVVNEQNGTDNPFGIVPSMYIPHMRVGGRYGVGHVQDLAALEKEFNASFAALGEAVLLTPDQKTYLSNNYKTPDVTRLSDGTKVIELGYAPASSGSKDAPKATVAPQPEVSEAMIKHLDKQWQQMLRHSHLSGIPFGEDEGSQRSGQTLALRMWPTMSHIGHERTNWNDGLTKLGKDILKMVKKIMDDEVPIWAKALTELGIELPDDYEKHIEVSTDWSPKIPQDRKQLVDETGILVPIGVRSKALAVEMLGDAPDINTELALIEDDQKQEAELAASQKPTPFGSNGTKPDKATGAVTSSTNGESAT